MQRFQSKALLGQHDKGDERDPVLGRLLSSRINHLELSFRTRMIELAAAMNDVITLGRGDPDFDTPTHIVAATQKALAGGAHHYTSPIGLAELRHAIADKLFSDNRLDYSPDEIVICNGCQEALFVIMQALLDSGDEVLLQTPRFNSYDHMVSMSGGMIVSVPTYERDDFAILADEIRRHISPRTRMLVIVNPNNPTGSVIPDEDLRAIASIAVEHDLIVISDEIYEKVVFDGRQLISLASLPGMWERTITVNGFSKAYAMTGWRVGYLAAPRPFVRAITELKHTISISTSTPMQMGALAALQGPQEPMQAMVAEYDHRRKYMMSALDQMGLTYGYPGGAMYIYANVSTTGLDAEEFCLKLLQEAGVMIFPGTMFADDGNKHVRISLLAPMPRMIEATERMGRFLDSL